MFTKLLILLHGKVLTIAAAGIVLLGGGTAVAVAATTGALPALHGASATPTPHDANDDHGSDATVTPGNINQNDDQHERHGVASNIGASSFTLTSANGTAVTVTVSSQTQFHDLKGLSSLKTGEQVEAKGTLQADGIFAATDIEAGNDDNDNQGAEDAHGTVVSVGSGSFVITITSTEGDGSSSAYNGAQLTVTVSSVTTFEDVSGLGAISVGEQVEVKGTFQADGTLAASSVERSSEGQGNGGNSGSGKSGDGKSGNGKSGNGGNGSSHHDG